ncbi:hypothetical protein [Aeromonas salmonicida]|uniref:hypothetical protein n=1 Tax=Aeromonas salmonicida TaxID=645 RepID=UPI00240E572A|nr:hypothetical protein [Aeromonas salmonicida]WFC15424.1 hypothetical protein L3V47_06650 [Aeromonas salmonicida]
MEVDKDLERQYRNKMMIIATLIIVYSISGGSLSPDFSLAGAKLSFSAPQNLVRLAVVVMLFFWWRHRQITVDVRHKIKVDAYRGCYIPDYLLRKIRENGTRNGSAMHGYSEGCLVGVKLTDDDQYEHDFISVQVMWARLLHITIYVIHSSREDRRPTASYEMTLTNFRDIIAIILPCWCSFARNAWSKPDFGDAILPTLVMVIAVISYLYN